MANITKVNEEVIKNLDANVTAVVGAKNIEGFEKAYLVSDAIGKLKEILSPEYMRPIMNLQGNALGFKTDKDADNGYPEAVVKNCLIEAVLIGLQPVGNHFNIIAGNMYPTKNGFGYLLAETEGLWYEIIPELPRIKADLTGAAVVMNIEWSMNGSAKQKRQIDFPIKFNKFMGTDAVIGKATRKARAWLFNTVHGTEIPDGDVQDADFKIVNTAANKPTEAEIETERWRSLIADCQKPADLMKYKEQIPQDNPAVVEMYEKKLTEFLD